MTIILKPAMKEITLDNAVLQGIRTFKNGCNFRVIFKDNDAYLEFGCYGVHVNLTQGMERLLYDWYVSDLPERYSFASEFCRLPKFLPISEETKVELKRRHPCDCCGAPLFKSKN